MLRVKVMTKNMMSEMVNVNTEFEGREYETKATKVKKMNTMMNISSESDALTSKAATMSPRVKVITNHEGEHDESDDQRG